jgi:hypothetical protein
MSNELNVYIDNNNKVTITGRPEFTIEVQSMGKNPDRESARRHMLHWAEHLRSGLETQLNALETSEQQMIFVSTLLQYNNVRIGHNVTLKNKIKALCNEINSNTQNLVWGDKTDNEGIENARDYLNKNKEAFLDGNIQNITTHNTQFSETTGQVEQLLRSTITLDKQEKEKIWQDMWDSVTLDIAHKTSSKENNQEGLLRIQYLNLAEEHAGTLQGQEYFKQAVSKRMPTKMPTKSFVERLEDSRNTTSRERDI